VAIYRKLLLRAAADLLQPFGLDVQGIERLLQDGRWQWDCSDDGHSIGLPIYSITI
jgi:hypothetical protein